MTNTIGVGLDDLAEARAAFRMERDRDRAEIEAARLELAEERRQTEIKSREAGEMHRRSRAIFQRFLRKMKTKWSGERRKLELERSQFEKIKVQHERDANRKESEREKATEQLGDYKRRLYEAWDLLGENQKRLLADRQRAETWIAQQTEAVDRRTRDLESREKKLDDNRIALETRAESLVVEIASLEARALNTRAVLRQLDEQRAKLDWSNAAVPLGNHLVSLESPQFDASLGNDANRLVNELREGTEAVARERQRLLNREREFEQRQSDVTDQRAILAEQVAALAAARDLWQNQETHTVRELESLARALRARELAAEERDREFEEVESQRRKAERELWQREREFAARQSDVLVQDAERFAERDRSNAEWQAKAAQLEIRESSLESVANTWAALRGLEKNHLDEERNFWREASAAWAERRKETDAVRTRFLATLGAIGANAMALEESRKPEPRRLKVLRKRWESHFAAVRREIDRREETIRAAEERLAERYAELQSVAAEWDCRRAEQVEGLLPKAQSQLQTVERIAGERMDRELVVGHERIAEREIHSLRAGIDALSKLLAEPPLREEEPVLLTLKAA